MVIKNRRINVWKPALLCFVGFIHLTVFGQGNVAIQYTDAKATAITFVSNCLQENLVVRLKGADVGMLGKIEAKNKIFIFKPSFPFSSNYTYEVLCGEQVIDSFSPKATTITAPFIVSVFPTQDTLPENLLKMHIVFSQPMATNSSYQHIRITENGKEVHPFLELESELWNHEKTVFTVWLDPGRIKRELTPNKLYGNPLTEGKVYQLEIDSLWQDQNGTSLRSTFTKDFLVGNRDEKLPSLRHWQIQANANEINIKFDEPLDYLLIQHSLTLWKDDQYISTEAKNESNIGVKLIPKKELTPGVYKLKVDVKLEDLAGNNLTRPFDNDLLNEVLSNQENEILIRIQNIK